MAREHCGFGGKLTAIGHWYRLSGEPILAGWIYLYEDRRSYDPLRYGNRLADPSWLHELSSSIDIFDFKILARSGQAEVGSSKCSPDPPLLLKDEI